MGEAAYLSEHREDLQSSFYKAIPGMIYVRRTVTRAFMISNLDIICLKYIRLYGGNNHYFLNESKFTPCRTFRREYILVLLYLILT